MSDSNSNYYQNLTSILQRNSSMQPMLSQSSSSLAPDENIEYPVLVLTQQPDSHHFNERRIILNDTIKVGRSVARARPCESNAIFDCKVLSRNHAIFWFDNGKVLLKDTKSSNGTFVNSQLLSKGTEDSVPREIYSGDIIQFGVEVVENTTTHGCIIAQTTIYLADGNELRRHSDMGGVPSGNIPISNYYEEQIYQLAQYIQEASHREQTLEKKLNSLSQLIIDTQEASDSSWKVILNQDRLMEKLELLQEQVDMHAKGDDHESLTVELQRVLEQRYGMERESKSMLESLMEEKTDVLQRVVDLEQSLGASEEECVQLRMALESLQSEHGQISERLSSGKDEVDGLQRKLQEAQTEYNNETSRLCQDKEVLLGRYDQLCVEAEDLRVRLELAESEIVHSGVGTEAAEGSSGHHANVLRELLQQLSERQSNLGNNVASLEGQLSRALLTEIVALHKLGHLEESMAHSEASIDSFIVGTTSDLGMHWIESLRQIKSGTEMIALLRDEVRGLQRLIKPNTSGITPFSTSSTAILELSFQEMDELLDKVDQSHSRTKTMVAEIPEKLLVFATDNMTCTSALVITDTSLMRDHEGGKCNHSVAQTETVALTESCSQCDLASIQSVALQVDLSANEVQSDPSLSQSLQQCLDNLKAERTVTESLKMDLLALQDEKIVLTRRGEELSLTIEELREEAVMAKQDMETRRDSVQKIASEGYGHLYQESQELRKRVQEIEEEMAQKRQEYDILYEQYDALISSQKVVSISNDSERIRELEELCAQQQSELERVRDSMTNNYQTIVARARKISAMSVVPLCVLLFGVIVSIISLLAHPWLPVDR